MNLLLKPKKNSQEIVSVTPQSAGWRYVSFSAHQLAPGNCLLFLTMPTRYARSF